MSELQRRHWKMPFADGSMIRIVKVAAESELIYVLNENGTSLSIYNKDHQNDRDGQLFSLKNKKI